MTKTKSKNHKTEYPWDTWLLGRKKSYTLVKGKDFECMVHSMAQQIRNAAYRRNVKVSITMLEDSLELRIQKKAK